MGQGSSPLKFQWRGSSIEMEMSHFTVKILFCFKMVYMMHLNFFNDVASCMKQNKFWWCTNF
jgi:hypothetical protein